MPKHDLAEELDFLSRVGSWEWPENARERILEGLDSPDPALRRAAVEVVDDIMDDELAGEVLEILDSDPDDELRSRTAIALGPALEECCDEADWDDSMVDAPLTMARYREIEDRLKSLYHDASSPKVVRRRALEAAIRSPQPWQEGAVRSAYAGDDPEWRATAVFCMAHLPGFDDEILTALGSDDPGVELEAVRAAGQRGIEKAAAALFDRAASEATERSIRLAAVEGLANVRPPGAQELLTSLSESDDEEIADVAEEALEEFLVWEMAEAEMDEDSELPDWL
ncbi:MAG: hypothetical protein GY856_53605 [bacterium]|nr:hypothetical protein [bacterium]